ncbi:hypothetical protein AYO20_04312 [Fonsecaea nubica]|uniref:General stress protein FMN-binding split barrel domain-containing protein n=1 Tax=Fonsecaea nubica TaxID=856822 RepID=A0A178D3V0_9EURO|nr:hypothetical protein AYO20_04312 [Fonsecaea nubica]OAL36416.1 hypothetical protein AYO20_04312 [Fonsecaea nubica]
MAADPYTAKNKDEPGLEEKINALNDFVRSSKFGMMTTRIADSGLLVSRCMALAAQVCHVSEILATGLPLDILSMSPARADKRMDAEEKQKHITNHHGTMGQESGGVDLLFHTNTESGKTSDLSSDEHVNMSFLNSSGSWASISGTASIITDRATVKKYYTPTLKTWVGDLGDGQHDGSENDPRIGIIKVKALTATYALPKGTMLGRGVEMVKGAVTGEVANVNELREINEQELQQWRSSH